MICENVSLNFGHAPNAAGELWVVKRSWYIFGGSSLLSLLKCIS